MKINFVINMYEKLNLSENYINVIFPLPVKMVHGFYVSKNDFEKF